MKVRFLALAQKELDDAVAGTTDKQQSWDWNFSMNEVDRAVRRTVSFPMSCPEIESGVRRCLLARFPYGLIYGVDGNTIVILAVAHLHRNPRYWVDRL